MIINCLVEKFLLALILDLIEKEKRGGHHETIDNRLRAREGRKKKGKRKEKRSKRKRVFFLRRSFSRSMTNFEATTSKQDAAYLHCHDKRDAHASRVRIIFPTIVRYEDNRWWWFGTTASCPRFLSLSNDRSMTDRKVLRSNRISRCS